VTAHAVPPALREDDVVAAIVRVLERPQRRGIVLGIGDDAALWQPSRSHRSAITTDMLVEGVHFARELMTLEDAGWRAMMANASDLAAMGARPVLATVALGIPSAASFDDVIDLYRGLASAASAAGLDIVGGDLSRARDFTVAIAAVGEVRPSNVKTRAGGRPGAVLAVTGALGASRAGLEAARDAATLKGTPLREALEAFRRPVARCGEGRFLGASRNVQAMMDCSDGLSTDVARLCAASGCGAVLESIPVADSARALCESRGDDPERFALAGGEDFELLVAVAPRAFAHLARAYALRFQRPLHRIGRLTEATGLTLRDGSRMQPSGWDHFA
jgi:thiamine-monophosphate kinase